MLRRKGRGKEKRRERGTKGEMVEHRTTEKGGNNANNRQCIDTGHNRQVSDTEASIKQMASHNTDIGVSFASLYRAKKLTDM